MKRRGEYYVLQDEAGSDGTAAAGGSGGAGEGSGAGGTGADWRAGLPEDVRAWDEFKTADDMAAGFERIEHMRSKFGTGLFAPGENASTEDWTKFYGKLSERTAGKVMPRPEADDVEAMNALYTQLGRPEDATGYEFSEGTDAETAAAFGELALSQNLSVAQMKGLDEGMNVMLVKQREAGEAQRVEGINTLKGEWGSAWPERVKIVEKVRGTFLDFIPVDQMSAATMTSLFNLGKALGGEGSELLKQADGVPEPTTLEAKDQIAELTGRISELQKSHDGSKRAEMKRLIEARRVLYKKAYPGGGFQVGGRQVVDS